MDRNTVGTARGDSVRVVGHGQQDIGVTRLVEWAVAREISAAQLSSDIVDSDRQAAGEQVVAVPANRFRSTERQRVRIAPLRRPRHDDDTTRKLAAFAAGTLEALRHRAECS